MAAQYEVMVVIRSVVLKARAARCSTWPPWSITQCPREGPSTYKVDYYYGVIENNMLVAIYLYCTAIALPDIGFSPGHMCSIAEHQDRYVWVRVIAFFR